MSDGGWGLVWIYRGRGAGGMQEEINDPEPPTTDSSSLRHVGVVGQLRGGAAAAEADPLEVDFWGPRVVGPRLWEPQGWTEMCTPQKRTGKGKTGKLQIRSAQGPVKDFAHTPRRLPGKN